MKSTAKLFQINVVLTDDNRPVFGNTPLNGYILQSSFRSDTLYAVSATKDGEGLVPLKLNVTDQDENEVNV